VTALAPLVLFGLEEETTMVHVCLYRAEDYALGFILDMVCFSMHIYTATLFGNFEHILRSESMALRIPLHISFPQQTYICRV